MTILLRDKYPALCLLIYAWYNQHLDLPNLSADSVDLIVWTTMCVFCGVYQSASMTIDQFLACHTHCQHCRNKKAGQSILRRDSVAIKYPHLLAEFDPALNPGIDLFATSCNSHIMVMWRCKDHSTCDMHIFPMKIYHRTNGSGCSWCNHKKCCPCESAGRLYPYLLEEFVPELNPGINLFSVAPKSDIEITWRCTKHTTCQMHIWKATPAGRASGNNCPWCGHTRCCPCNSFAVKYPNLLAEFHPALNPGINPFEISCGSGMDIVWYCKDHKTCNMHIWTAKVCDRTNGHDCPWCSHKRVCQCDSVATLYPLLLTELDPIRNWGVNFNLISTGCGTSFFWRCLRHTTCQMHIWHATISARLSGQGCSWCSHVNECCPCDSFARLHPELLKEFKSELNPGIDPYNYSSGSNVSLKWCCQTCNTIRSAMICSRTRDRGCPRCCKSILEKKCSDILTNMGLTSHPDKYFTDCRNDKTNCPLPFDFYLFLRGFLNIIIELDGEQHFDEVSIFTSKDENLESRLYRDNLKNWYCFNTKKHLLRISYGETNNIEIHIRRFLQAVLDSDPNGNPVIHFCGKEYLEQQKNNSFTQYVTFF